MMGYTMRNRQGHPIRAFKGLSLCVLIASSLTFSLPKEYFDPHPGVGVDIFCKSLTFIGAEFQGDLYVVAGGPVLVGEVDDVHGCLLSMAPIAFRAIRAPPSFVVF